jgi:hypothetical protein
MKSSEILRNLADALDAKMKQAEEDLIPRLRQRYTQLLYKEVDISKEEALQEVYRDQSDEFLNLATEGKALERRSKIKVDKEILKITAEAKEEADTAYVDAKEKAKAVERGADDL